MAAHGLRGEYEIGQHVFDKCGDRIGERTDDVIGIPWSGKKVGGRAVTAMGGLAEREMQRRSDAERLCCSSILGPPKRHVVDLRT